MKVISIKWGYFALICLAVAALYFNFQDKDTSHHFYERTYLYDISFKPISEKTISGHPFFADNHNKAVYLTSITGKDSNLISKLKLEGNKSLLQIDSILTIRKRGIIPMFCAEDTVFSIQQGLLHRDNKYADFQYTNIHIYNYSAIPLENDRMLFFGADLDGNDIGFFMLSNNHLIASKKIIHYNTKDDIYKNNLVYSGHFVKSENYVIYYCDKSSLIYIFTSDGEYIKTIKTKENIPLPFVTRFGDGTYIYKRGLTYGSFSGAFMWENDLFLASLTIDKNITLDRYSIDTNSYVGSYSLDFLPIQNKDIAGLFCFDSFIYLFTKTNLYIVSINTTEKL